MLVTKRPKKSRRFEMKVDPAWLDAVEAVAAALDMSVAAYVRLAVTEKMRRDRASDEAADQSPQPEP